MRVLIFGAGIYGKFCMEFIEKSIEYTLVGFLDNADPKPVVIDAAGNSVPVYAPEDGICQSYDMLIISNVTPRAIAKIKAQLASLGVPKEKIHALHEDRNLLTNVFLTVKRSIYDEEHDPRVNWLRDLAHYVKQHQMAGSVAECGVNLGDFSYYINKYFPS